MKRLVLVRHGDAAPWAEGGDHGRPLTPVGVDEARRLGQLLGAMDLSPALVVHSTATRAAQTAEALASAATWTTPLQPTPEIYDASASLLLAVVHTLPPDADTVVLVGHQPGIGQLASLLAGGASFNVTTGCAIGLGLARDDWRGVAARDGWLLWMSSAELARAAASEPAR